MADHECVSVRAPVFIDSAQYLVDEGLDAEVLIRMWIADWGRDASEIRAPMGQLWKRASEDHSLKSAILPIQLAPDLVVQAVESRVTRRGIAVFFKLLPALQLDSTGDIR